MLIRMTKGFITPPRFGLAVVVLLLFLVTGSPKAETQALEQLIELLEANKAISPQQAATLRAAIARDRQRMEERERSLREAERAVSRREMELRQREEALAHKGAPAASQGVGQEGLPSAAPQASSSEKWEIEEKGGMKEAAVREKSPGGGLPLEAVFDNGFWVRTREKDLFSMRIGTLLQTDYRYFSYDSSEDPDKNRFDIRRARLILGGDLLRRFHYFFQYEFQGAGSRRLLDAYVDTRILPWISMRAGQFKTPFGLEQSSADKNIPFAERSMGFLLTPLRDVGLMAHGSFWDRRVDYGLGIFNGDGVDDSVGGDEDSPGFVGRIVLTPFRDQGDTPLGGLHVGGSFSYAKVDRNNVNIKAMTTGLTTFFNVNASAKFKIIREADYQTRFGAELSWNYGPLLVWGEYTNLNFSHVRTSSDEFNIDVSDCYGALLWMVTGERPSIIDGRIQPIRPLRNLWQGGWGALGLGFRYDTFDAGKSVYQYLINSGDSVREATSYTVALNWHLNPYVRLLVDATRTRFDRPLLIDRDPITGETIYAQVENVFTGRFQFQF